LSVIDHNNIDLNFFLFFILLNTDLNDLSKIFPFLCRDDGTMPCREKRIVSVVQLKMSALAIIFFGFLNVNQTAQGQERRIIPFITEGINYDGIPDEEIWTKVGNFPLLMYSPDNGKIPGQKTDVRLFFDETYLYMGVSAHYSTAGMISRIGKTRDYTDWNSDWICIALDTYNDKQNMMLFAVNPNGIRMDGTTKNNMINGMYDVNFNFNTFWDAKVKIAGNVWHTEIRIPLSSLRFQGKTDKVTMGIIILRSIANAEDPDYGQATFPEIPQTKGVYQFWRASMGEEVEFTGLKSKKPVYFTPYVLGGFNRIYDADISAPENEYKYEAGADFKLGLTNNLTLDITANTDFAQVEADQEQFNLTRFSLFFPEKRLFFQEKSDVFDFPFYSDNNLFYSRNIGLYNGNPVRIYGGLRLSGRMGNWDIGALDMQTAGFEKLPGQNFGVIRTKKRILNQNSFIGGIITSKIGTDGTYNLAYGVDTKLNIFGDDYLTLKWAQTYQDDAENKPLSVKPANIYLRWGRNRNEGFIYAFLVDWSGEDFNPGIGLEIRDNFFYKSAMLQYGWLPGIRSHLNSHNIFIKSSVYNSSLDNSLESVATQAGWNFVTKKTTEGKIYLNWEIENLKNTFLISNPGVFVPRGRYNSFFINGSLYAASPDRTLSLTLTPEAGTYYDGYKLSASLLPGLNIGSGAMISGNYRIDRIVFNKRDIKYTNNIFGLKGLFMFTTKLSLTTYVQYNTFSHRIITNARLHYNPREGNDLYIVYNEGISSHYTTNLHIDQENEIRTILLKYTCTFAF
jgi:hypothetical protein